MFADLGHFNVTAVQISFTGMVFLALLIAYSGQAAYLSKFPDHVKHIFYDSIPGPQYWPTFVVANAAAIIASQAMISGAFSIISQSLSLSCFPRVKVVRTSAKYEGQVYIPDINYFLSSNIYTTKLKMVKQLQCDMFYYVDLFVHLWVHVCGTHNHGFYFAKQYMLETFLIIVGLCFTVSKTWIC
ncbi:potassium transporter 5-like [Primulina tabacum]|uniref:potassium transporter 5-like n=1 Tax=Primulina tabacum TaxID=48773 RepID=UPI003F5A5186